MCSWPLDIPDKNGNCPPPMYMRSAASQVMYHSVKYYVMISVGKGARFGFRGSTLSRAVETLPVSVDNITIVNRGQVDAYCNGFSDGEQALANHPDVRSHVNTSMVLSDNATGFSDTIKIMPKWSAAEIRRTYITNQTHTAS